MKVQICSLTYMSRNWKRVFYLTKYVNGIEYMQESIRARREKMEQEREKLL